MPIETHPPVPKPQHLACETPGCTQEVVGWVYAAGLYTALRPICKRCLPRWQQSVSQHPKTKGIHYMTLGQIN